MSVILGSTGITFPDATTQTTAATAGAAPGLVLISSTNATSATTLQNLNAFSSTYDNYLIVGDGLSPATAGILGMRVAVAGSVVTAGNPYQWNITNGATFNGDVSWPIYYTTMASSSSNGCSFQMFLLDVNNTTRYKTMNLGAVAFRSSTSTWQGNSIYGVFLDSTSALTGVQLYFQNGSNFLAQGNMKIYGFKNS